MQFRGGSWLRRNAVIGVIAGLRSVPAIAMCVCLASLTTTNAARAGVVGPSNCTVPAGIVLVGSTAGVPDPQGLFSVVIRDLANNPMPGLTVDIEFDDTPDLRPASVQLYPGLTVRCDNRVSAVTDAFGTARFIIMGGADPYSGPGTVGGHVKVRAAGTLIATMTGNAYDLDGNNGVDRDDIALWLCDFTSGLNFARSDFDFSGTVNVIDLSLLVNAMNAGNSSESGVRCGSFAQPPPPIVVSGGLTLGWDDCRVAASNPIKTFNCASNTGSVRLVASLTPPTDLDAVTAVEADFDIANPAGALPDWWRFQPGGCRINALSTQDPNTDPAITCSISGVSQTSYASFTYPFNGDPSVERVHVTTILDPAGASLFSADQTALIKLVLNRTKSTGVGSCANCSAPVNITLRSMRLSRGDPCTIEPALRPADMIFNQSSGLNVAYWQSAPAPEDTSTCQTATWSQVVGTGPSGRYEHAMSSNTSRGVVVMFGGQNAPGSFLGDTWEWDGSSWAQTFPSTHPSARSSHAMAYDSKRDRVVLFGGTGASGLLGDTWGYDQATATWTLLSSSGPSARADHVMAYDSERDRMVLFGGNDGVAEGDTWEWDGSTWTQIAVSGPGATQNAAMTFDTGRAQMCLYSGDSGGAPRGEVWEWDGAEWAKLDDAISVHRSHAAVTYGDDCSGTFLFGGNGDGPDLSTRFFNGTTWFNLTGGPQYRLDGAMAYDAATDRVLLFGGKQAAPLSDVLNDTWTYCCSCGTGEALTDANGNLVPPLNWDPTEPITTEEVDTVLGDTEALYPGLDTSDDNWFPNDPCDPDIGGTIDPIDSLNTTVQDLLDEGIHVITSTEIADAMGPWGDAINTLFGDVDETLTSSPSVMANYTPPATAYTPPPGQCYVFGGRDLVFVHGLRLDPLIDKIFRLNVAAFLAWVPPTSFPPQNSAYTPINPQFHGTGYWAAGAERYWRKHIERYLTENHIMNRYLIVAWPSTQRLNVGVQAVLTQIGEAMNYGTGVVDPSGNNNKSKFGTPSYVAISHSTGGLMVDACMYSAANYGNLNAAPIANLCKTQVSIQSAFNGSNEALAMVAFDQYLKNQVSGPFPKALEPSWLCPLVNKIFSKGTNNTQLSCPIGTPTPLGVISASVLVDLCPPVTQLRWGKYMDHTPVPSILLSGGHPTYNRLIKQLLLRGFDDGVLSSNSQTANPNSFIFGPAGYRATKFREVKDMGIMQDGKKRMRGYLLDQIVDPAISGLLPGLSLLTRRVSAGATPWISPTGMRQPVRRTFGSQSGLDPKNRYGFVAGLHTHFSFLQSAADHFGNTPAYDSDFNGNNYRDSDGLLGGFFGATTEYNAEETRVMTDQAIYLPTTNPYYPVDTQPLLAHGDAPKTQIIQRGNLVNYGTITKGRRHKKKKWLWERQYVLLKDWQSKMACDYMYESVLKAPLPPGCLPAPTPSPLGGGLQVAGMDWLHDAFPFNATVGLPGTAPFDTTAALIKTGRNIAQLTGTTARFDVPGDSLVVCSCDPGMRLDFVFRIVPGPGNYRIASGRSMLPGSTPSGVLLQVPTNQSAVVSPGDASFWGQYIADPGTFSAGSHRGHTSWDPVTWNSARMDTAELNIFPVSALGNLPKLSNCSWSATYHEADPKYATLGINKFKCTVVDTTRAATSSPALNNVDCSGTIPAWLTTVPQGHTGWNGSAVTKEYTKILPDGLFTPGTHVEYFIRKSKAADPFGAFSLVPDTTLVTLQTGEGSMNCSGEVVGSGSDDGHRWQEFGVLPDRWKATEFGGAGMACMLYVDLNDSHGDERAWTSVAELIGATSAAKRGSHDGYKTTSFAADPNDPSRFVATHGGEAGTTWDKFDVRGIDDALDGHAGSIGSRLSQTATGFATGKDSRIGPTPSMLSVYYKLLYVLSGNSRDRLLGPVTDMSQGDIGMIEGFLTSGTLASPKGIFVEGDAFVESETASGIPAHLAFLSNYLGATLRSGSYAQASSYSSPCVDLRTTSLVSTVPGIFATTSLNNETNDVLNTVVGFSQPASFYADFGSNSPFVASVYKPATVTNPWIALTDGWDIKRMMSRYCANGAGRLAYLFNALNKVFGGSCTLTGPAGAVTAVEESTVPLERFARVIQNPVRNGIAVIELGLPTAEMVTVRVYDVAGRMVREVAKRPFEPGVHRVLLERADAQGTSLRPGMFFVQVRFGNQHVERTDKLVLLH